MIYCKYFMHLLRQTHAKFTYFHISSSIKDKDYLINQLFEVLFSIENEIN